jgi:hypothetical protein
MTAEPQWPGDGKGRNMIGDKGSERRHGYQSEIGRFLFNVVDIPVEPCSVTGLAEVDVCSENGILARRRVDRSRIGTGDELEWQRSRNHGSG